MSLIELVRKGEMESLAHAKRAALMLRGAIRKSVAEEAHLLRTMMVKGLRDQAPGGDKLKPLSEMTIKLRGLAQAGSKNPKKSGSVGTKALIHHGDLLGSIKAQKNGDLSWTVGVHRGTKGKNGGKDMEDIAAIHEYGTRTFSVVVTAKMRRFSMFLVAMGILGAPWKLFQILRIKIPPRPFLGPSHREWVKDADDRYRQRINSKMSAMVF